MGLGWFSCHQGKPDGQRFFWVSDLSLQPGPHLVLTLPFLKTPREVRQAGSNHVTQDWGLLPTLLYPIPGSLPFHWQEGSCPLPTLLPSRELSLWEAVVCWAWNLSGGVRKLVQRVVGRPLWSVWTIFTRSREAPLGGLGGARPLDVSSYLWAALAVHTARWASLDLGFSLPHFWVAESFFGWLTPVMTRPESCVLSQGAFSSFSVLGCACRATWFLLPISSGPSRTLLIEVRRPAELKLQES